MDGGGTSGWSGASGSSGSSGWDGSPHPDSSIYVNEAGWYAESSNPYGIQGYVYMKSDRVSVYDHWDGEPNLWNTEKQAYCIAGETREDPTYQSWGALINFDLNGVDVAPYSESRQRYDWRAHGVKGFEIGYTLEGHQEIQIAFFHDREVLDQGGFSPYIVGHGSGEYLFTEASVPNIWGVPNAGFVLTDEPVYSVEIKIVGAVFDASGPFTLCIHHFRPIPASEPTTP